MLRTTFEEIIEMTRSEARLSTNSSRGIDHLDYVRQVIRRNYALLAEQFDWEHLRLKRGDAYKALSAGQRYYNFPTNLNPQKIECAWVKWSGLWDPVGYQITNDNYNDLDSDQDQRSDPVERWDYYANADLNQFEVWPIPASNDVTIYFEGQKIITALTENASRADLDDHLLALASAAEMLRDQSKDEAADRKEAKFQERLITCRAGSADKSRFAIGMSDPKMRSHVRRPREIKYVRST